MLSNHNTMLVNELYKDYHIYLIETKRSIILIVKNVVM